MTPPLPSEVQTLTLSDGRTLAYAAFGAGSDAPAALPAPGTTTIFYFHGFPASRLEGALWHEAALAQRARIIAPDRPGMGLSSFQPARTILDWPSDVLALADHLHVEHFSVLGASGGAPYVLACARSLPATRLRGAAVVSGLYPVALGTTGMLWQGRVLLWAARRMVGAVALLLDWGLGRAARNAKNPQMFRDLVMRDMSQRPDVDRRCVEQDERFRTRFLESIRESFRSGSRGVAWDARLLGTPWGFELADGVHEGLTLWHGGLDVNSPIGMAKKAATLLNGARLEVFEPEGHVSLVVHHMNEIVERLAAPRSDRSR